MCWSVLVLRNQYVGMSECYRPSVFFYVSVQIQGVGVCVCVCVADTVCWSVWVLPPESFGMTEFSRKQYFGLCAFDKAICWSL